MAYTQSDRPTEKFTRIDPGPIWRDASDTDGEGRMEVGCPDDILRIAIDFGTTFSSVAYARTPASNYHTTLMDITCISRYPGDRPLPMVSLAWEPRQDVPTELWYPQSASDDPGRQSQPVPTQEDEEDDHESLPESDSGSALLVIARNDEEPPKELPRGPDPTEDEIFGSTAWGFEVQAQLATEDVSRDSHRRIARSKLLLGDPEELLGKKSRGKIEKMEQIKVDALEKLKKLRKLKLIGSNTDVITHFLRKLFLHIRKELQIRQIFDPMVAIEFILCVPAEWPSKACRIMQNAMAIAVSKSGLGQPDTNSIDSLFIVSEPEAAAASIMAENDKLFRGETIVILDAGGGTVDAVSYKVTNSEPLRVSAEIVRPKTKFCGASYINERYRSFLLKKLKDEIYLENNGQTLRSIVDRKVFEFEITTKRVWDLYDQHCVLEPIWIDGLHSSQTDRQLQQNRIDISKKDVEWIYRPSLKGTVSVLEDQLDLAKVKAFSVQKVLLTGGFGQSPFLQNHLRDFLANETNFSKQAITLVVPRAASTAVVRGAILRASDKTNGPSRQSSCSYGFIRHEPWEPDLCPAHNATKPRTDRVDGEKYVHNTIDWLFQKGEELTVGMSKSINVIHTFETNEPKLICEETVYVSDDFKVSHYRRNHAMNTGAELAGQFLVDMTFLKDEGHIQPETVSYTSSFAGKKKQVWIVEFELVVTVDGRNLVSEARWPVRNDEGNTMEEQKVCVRALTCIAATFRPGTA